MPGPDPHAFWIERAEPPYSVCFQAYFWTGNNGNRKARAIAILRRLYRRDWFCRWCGDDLPDYVRADALYCGESCRKKAARDRRAARSLCRKGPDVNARCFPLCRKTRGQRAAARHGLRVSGADSNKFRVSPRQSGGLCGGCKKHHPKFSVQKQ